MAFALRLLLLVCGVSGLLTGVWSKRNNHEKRHNSCPKGWTQLGGRCFVFQDHRMEFADAETICNILGGNLASFHSASEYAVVLELTRAASDPTVDVWLGLHKTIEDTFFWTDGSEFNFTAFNNNNSAGDCFEIERSDDLWDNDNCGDRNTFVCARRADQCSH
ncbi:galactose-specific lectin nattectin-like [Hippocampus zosterae]|uniref:galactose-specific lectin nattectin-like n=1 Tax=Hippocampus zosterae TaxID=109293 RepID=UPI00223DC199|nr:galactose-specific lectin nattectin-like [Hippocampus zosterae]